MSFLLKVGLTFYVLLRINSAGPQLETEVMGNYKTVQECVDMGKNNIIKEGNLPGIKYSCLEVTPVLIEGVSNAKVALGNSAR